MFKDIKKGINETDTDEKAPLLIPVSIEIFATSGGFSNSERSELETLKWGIRLNYSNQARL